jgi:hypothetical protein
VFSSFTYDLQPIALAPFTQQLYKNSDDHESSNNRSINNDQFYCNIFDSNLAVLINHDDGNILFTVVPEYLSYAILTWLVFKPLDTLIYSVIQLSPYFAEVHW